MQYLEMYFPWYATQDDISSANLMLAKSSSWPT